MLNKKTILVTGGTGSFGKAFIKNCLKKFKAKKIIVFSRDELKLSIMEKEFSNFISDTRIRYLIGDVRDYSRLKMALKNVDIVIHAAALKHVPIAEYNPFEVIKTNIIGAQNIIEACLDSESKVKKVVALSTDKAAAPINLYGASKLASDKLFISANNIKGEKDIKFSVVRYGNVLGSRGSVLEYFLSRRNEQFLNITDKKMTRFNILLDEGVKFVLFALKNMWGGELFVPKLKSYFVTDLAKAAAPKTKHKIVGIRPGEKIHEEMITVSDSLKTVEFKKYYVILPDKKFVNWSTKKYLSKNKSDIGKYVSENFSYDSKNNPSQLLVSDLKKIIK